MRIMFAGLLTSAVLCTGIASAHQCAQPADVYAFDVASLKTKLMVTALTCNQRDRYNDFVQRFRSDLMVHEHVLQAYFARAFGGGHGQQEHDNYVTSLANTQSQSGIQQGTYFCQQNVGIFNEVMAVRQGADLANYAASKSLVQPIEIVACPAPTRTAQVGATRH